MKSAAVLLILIALVVIDVPHLGGSGAAARQGTARAGPVRADGRAVTDAGGPFNALGATLFWGAWGYKFDRPRLERNLQVLSAAGIDYVRVLGSVGGASWEDRETDPRWSDYDAVAAGMTDLAYDRYGMRVQWTIFGGAPFTADRRPRESLVDRFADVARGREHKIFAFEIANESWQTGFRGAEGLAELRRLGRRLSDKTTVLVALSSPATGAACDTYADAGVDAMTLHYQRSFGSEGPVRPLLRPWAFPDAYNRACQGKLPSIVFNNEPIGPESSVRQDDSPSRIAAGYVMTFLAGNASYVLHAGPGIRGGGAADISPKLRRHAHFDELPSFAPITAALAAAKQYLPHGLANWTRHGPGTPTAPLQGSARVYAASDGLRFVALAMGAKGALVVRSRNKASIDVRQTGTGALVRRLDVSAGEKIALPAGEWVVLIGTSTAQ
jgi:hypothetical protein